MSPQKLTHLHTCLLPAYNTSPAVGCDVGFHISGCRKTGSVSTVKLPVRLREELRDAGRSQPREIYGESRVVTITPSRPIRPVFAAPVITNSVASHGIFGHAPSGLQQDIAMQHPVALTNEGVVHTRTQYVSGQNTDKVFSTVQTTHNQRAAFQHGIVTPHTDMVTVSPRSVTVPNNMILRSVAFGNAAKQLAKHKQVYKWAAERVLNRTNIMVQIAHAHIGIAGRRATPLLA